MYINHQECFQFRRRVDNWQSPKEADMIIYPEHDDHKYDQIIDTFEQFFCSKDEIEDFIRISINYLPKVFYFETYLNEKYEDILSCNTFLMLSRRAIIKGHLKRHNKGKKGRNIRRLPRFLPLELLILIFEFVIN